MNPTLALTLALAAGVAAHAPGAGGAATATDQPGSTAWVSPLSYGADARPSARHLAAAGEPGTDVRTPVAEAPPTPNQLRMRNAAVIAGSSLLVGAYGLNKWWNDGFTGDFRTVNEGWFGQDSPYGGADKLGHAFFAYTGTRLLTVAFESVGNDPRHSLWLGAWTTLGIMTAIEVLDGYSRQYRFSAEDAIMNVVGTGAAYLMERNPDLDRLLDFRLLYQRSAGKFDPGGDYSGQKYLLAFKASGVPALRETPVLRYLELSLGYGTRGYESSPGVERSRNLYFGVSLNLSEILAQTVYRGAKARSRTQRATDLFFEFIQVPGTVALADHQL